jgi:glycosyltransferase involved in cell wall biosynthesis
MRPKVLVIVGTYLPGMKGGGPIRSIANMVRALAGEIDFRVITSDRDLGDDTPYPSITPGRWTETGVLYLSPNRFSPGSLSRILASEPADYLYLNSFFSWEFSILPMLLRLAGFTRQKRLMLAPRGEFSPGALGLKPRRKRFFIEIARRLPMYRQVLWHASSAYEERDIRNLFGDSAQVRVALPISAIGAGKADPESTPPAAKAPGSLRLISLSRVSPKKNLLGALRMLQGVTGEVEFDIYGPPEDQDYARQCAAAIHALPPNIRARMHPAVSHEKVAGLFSKNHLFYFPTLGENYGHVICEALAAGCPALISDRTPWRGLERAGAGWDLPLESPERFRAAIQRAVDMTHEELLAAAANARRFARDFAGPEQIARSRAIFLDPPVSVNPMEALAAS